MVTPTAEQLEALAKFRTGRPLKVTAFAGAGKTTTLKLLAGSRPDRGIYLAFNKAIQLEAAEKFPDNVACSTTHSLAWQSIAPRFSSGQMTGTMNANQLAELMELKDRVFAQRIRLTGVHQAHLILRTIRRFCQSADPEVLNAHVPQYGRLLGLKPAITAEVNAWAVEAAKALWQKMTNHRDKTPLGHDGYLKLWALGRPQLGYNFILLDEAQDTNPVVLGVLADQPSQIVYVGDRHQQIYEWRGAVNAMQEIKGCEEAYLTQSFRFGQLIADAASKVLRSLGERHSIRGNPAVQSVISDTSLTGTVLCRTNATVILEVLDALEANLKAHVVGGTAELERLLSDVFELKKGEPGICPEFFGFTSWDQVVAFSETEEGEDIRTFVQLVEQHGEKKLWRAIKSAHDSEADADLILSTAHKAKGREWDTVRLTPDFLNSRLTEGHPDAESEVRLFYVAMTRAKQHLAVDPAMLATFASNAWKTRTVDDAATPGERQPHSPPRPSSAPRRTLPPPTRIREHVSDVARSSYPPAVQVQSPKRSVETPAQPPPKEPSFWQRIGRLLGG